MLGHRNHRGGTTDCRPCIQHGKQCIQVDLCAREHNEDKRVQIHNLKEGLTFGVALVEGHVNEVVWHGRILMIHVSEQCNVLFERKVQTITSTQIATQLVRAPGFMMCAIRV